jgi:leucine dehydrogenase
LAAHGASVIVTDLDGDRGQTLAEEIGGEWLPETEFLTAKVDILSPCAVGAVLTPEAVNHINAWAICGGANNQLSSPGVDDLLAKRGIAYVPDFLASSGAVIDGIARSVMHIDPAPLIARLEETALRILQQARVEGRGTDAIGRVMARSRIDTARHKNSPPPPPQG